MLSDNREILRTYEKWWLHKKVRGREIVKVKYIGNLFYGNAYVKYKGDKNFTPVFSYSRRPRKYNLILDKEVSNAKR